MIERAWRARDRKVSVVTSGFLFNAFGWTLVMFRETM